MKDRIVQIMEVERLTPSSFADKLHVGRAVVSHILNGRNNPSLDVVMRILDAMPYIDSDWLLMGKGNMRKEENMIVRDSQSPYNVANDAKELDLFENTASNDIEKETAITNVSDDKHQATNVADAHRIDDNESIKHIVPQQLPIVAATTDKKIDKIIIYYSDKTFQAFNPDNEGF